MDGRGRHSVLEWRSLTTLLLLFIVHSCWDLICFIVWVRLGSKTDPVLAIATLRIDSWTALAGSTSKADLRRSGRLHVYLLCHLVEGLLNIGSCFRRYLHVEHFVMLGKDSRLFWCHTTRDDHVWGTLLNVILNLYKVKLQATEYLDSVFRRVGI